MAGWNPWHGCHKLSAGCKNCYVYRIDGKHGKDSSVVSKTQNFSYPVKRNRRGEYTIPSGETVYTCFSSDFFLEDADPWRPEAWQMIRTRQDLRFFMITKRIDRLALGVPPDWGNGYENVTICCTVENQDRADYRLPIYKEAPVKHKWIVCEPLLGKLDLTPYLGDWVEEVLVGGESGPDARICNFDWVLDLRRQCMEKDIRFIFRQTGAKLMKDGKIYSIKRQFQSSQARKAAINYKEEESVRFSYKK
ncbi:DUF5131 family protein [Parabacteroides pacaensis]|uniref:DUF5131 family protein n=1 Tax=Parabacteroides pacaensis TaxID=2086575 RepID=UPI000D0EF96C|nr:DUF5131 family protein [Parabacteroides pacaensis]